MRARLVHCWLTLVAAGMLCSCATSARPGGNEVECVRKVDYRWAREQADLAVHAQKFCNTMYPRLCALFADNSLPAPPQRFDVVLKPLASRNRGETFMEWRTIWVNSDYLTNAPLGLEQFDKVLLHEMAHMALRHKAFRWSRTDGFWEEGLADYAFYKLIGTNGWACPECNARFPHFTAGYTCTGAFLLFLENRYGSGLVRQLNAALAHRTFSDAFFLEATGYSLAELWTDFEQTPAYKPIVTEVLEMQRALGYRNGQPPRRAVTKFYRYVELHGDQFTRTALQTKRTSRQPLTDMPALITTYLYFMQPGGPAEKAVKELRDAGALPGFAAGEKGTITAQVDFAQLQVREFPQTRELACFKKGGDVPYRYVLTRSSKEAAWKVTRAWRATAEGAVLEELPVLN